MTAFTGVLIFNGRVRVGNIYVGSDEPDWEGVHPCNILQQLQLHQTLPGSSAEDAWPPVSAVRDSDAVRLTLTDRTP